MSKNEIADLQEILEENNFINNKSSKRKISFNQKIKNWWRSENKNNKEEQQIDKKDNIETLPKIIENEIENMDEISENINDFVSQNLFLIYEKIITGKMTNLLLINDSWKK